MNEKRATSIEFGVMELVPLCKSEKLWSAWDQCTDAEKRAFLERVRKEFLKPAVRVDKSRDDILAHRWSQPRMSLTRRKTEILRRDPNTGDPNDSA